MSEIIKLAGANSENLISGKYLIMRKQKFWEDENPVFYPSSNNPNFPLLAIGSMVVVEKELGGEIKFLGYGEIDSIEELPEIDSNEQTVAQNSNRYKVNLGNFVKFYPPRRKTNEIRNKIRLLPYYNWFDSIRPISKDVYEYIIRIYTLENWHEYFSRYPAVGSDLTKLHDVLLQEESVSLEFKSSLLTPTKPSDDMIRIQRQIENNSEKQKLQELRESLRKAEKEQINYLQDSIIKTIAAFLNTKGGILLVGIDDNKQIIGINKDYNNFHDRKSWDGWSQHLRNLINNYISIGPIFSSQIDIRPIDVEEITIAMIDVPPGPIPAFVKSREGKSEDLYLRTGNSTRTLKMSEVTSYINMRWSK